MKRENKKIVTGLIALIAVIVIFFGLYTVFSPKAQDGSKNITIEVIDNEEKSILYELSTDAEYLRQAMEEADGLTFSGEEAQFGFTLLEINGLTADYTADSAYWSILVNGEYGQYGVDSQIITDGDAFQLVYTVYK